MFSGGLLSYTHKYHPILASSGSLRDFRAPYPNSPNTTFYWKSALADGRAGQLSVEAPLPAGGRGWSGAGRGWAGQRSAIAPSAGDVRLELTPGRNAPGTAASEETP